MSAAIYSHQYLIGHTNLQPGDTSMGGVYGEFIPTAEYYSRVQPGVWKFWASAPPDYAAWQALALNVQLENGYFLFSEGGYTIDDIAELPDEPKRIDLAGVAAEILEDFIQIDPPRTFVEEPWEALTIQQKLALEAELSRELSNNSTIASAFAFNRQSLTEPMFSALCRVNGSDIVLFCVHNPPDFTSHFALVDLTSLGSQEKLLNFSETTFFNSFAEFKLERMYPDKSDWEY